MINEDLKLRGDVAIVLKDKDGNVKDSREIHNLVVSAGLEFICSRMAGTSAGVMSHMALGSDTTAAAAGQTDLLSILGAREALDSSTASNNTLPMFRLLKLVRALVRLQRLAYLTLHLAELCFAVQCLL